MTHGCSPFAVTRRKLTALDIVTASTTLPGREDVALLLEEHMRAQGWTGGRMEERRKLRELRQHRIGKRRNLQEGVEKALNIDPRWWGDAEPDYVASELSDDEDEDFDMDKDVAVYTSISSYRSRELMDPRPPLQIIRLCWYSPQMRYPTYSRPSSPTFDLPCGIANPQMHYTCFLDSLYSIVIRTGSKI